MRQPFTLKRQKPTERDPNDTTSSFTGQSVDEWLAAAVAEQANRAAARKAELAEGSDRRPAPEPVMEAEPDQPEVVAHDTPAVEPHQPQAARSRTSPPAPQADMRQADTRQADMGTDPKSMHLTGSERLTVETAAKTAAALGSVTSWIERAQEQLSAATVASSEAQKRTEAVVSDALGALGKRLEQIERRVESSGPAESDGDHEGNGLESRLRQAASRPAQGAIARRGMSIKDEIEAAVTEIRGHQEDLSREAPADDERVHEGSSSSRPQTGFLAALRGKPGEMAAPTDYDSAEMDLDGVFALRRELDDLRGSIEALATRDQVTTIEQSLQGLAIDLADVRHRGGELASFAGSAETIHQEIQRLANQRGPTEQIAKLGRDIDVLSHKLDIVAASGIDPAVIDTLTREVGEIRELFSSQPAPTDLSGLDDQLTELRREIARISARQVDPREFTTLRIAVEEMRQSVGRPAELSDVGMEEAQAALQQIAREEIGPVLSMMSELGQKIERLEQSVGDTGPLDGIEREIASLAKAVSTTPHSDPALASLHQGLTALMNEVATWREGTIEIAERAARRIAEETMSGWRSAPAPEQPAPASVTAIGKTLDERTQESLETVHTRLEDVVRRIGRLDTSLGAANEASRAPAQPARVDAPPAHVDEYDRSDYEQDLMAEADRPLPAHTPDAHDEVLLEPGSDRPRPGSSYTDPVGDGTDIKASFIAAARRAAQAAAADANRSRSSRFSDSVTAASSGPSEHAPSRLRATLDRIAKPVLIAAAAIVIAIGGLRIAANLTDGSSTNRVAAVPERTATPPVISAPARNVAPSADAPDPTTTQGLPSPSTDRQLSQATGLPADVSTTPTAQVAQSPRVDDTVAKVDVPRTDGAKVDTPRSVADIAKNDAARIEPARVDTSKVDAARPKVEASLSAPTQPLPATGLVPADTGPTPGSSLTGLKQAAAAGDSVALYELAARTADGRGVTRDPKAAAALFEKAADKNFAPAQYRAGNIYEKGIGIPRDIDVAKKWYARAADNGNTRAMHNLAVLIAEGGGGKPDYVAATQWFQRAADYGVRDSQFNLAVLAARGLGGSQDLVKSYTWFAIAAVQGDEEAGRKRDEVGSRLSPTDLAKAKAAAERWRPLAAAPGANEVQLPPGGWAAADAGPAKKAVR